MKVVSIRGEKLDVSYYMAQQESTPAVGNASMNTRGDVIGRGGTVVKRREQVAQEYYRSNPRAAKQVSLKDIAGEVMTPSEAVASVMAERQRERDQRAQQQRAQQQQQPAVVSVATAAASIDSAAGAAGNPRGKQQQRKITDSDE